jgi:hypothetical protein
MTKYNANRQANWPFAISDFRGREVKITYDFREKLEEFK